MLDIERKRIREDRQIILDWLNAVFPSSLAEETICEAASQMAEPLVPELVRRDLAYVEGLKLVERSVRDHPIRRHVKETHWKLTSAGVDFIERGMPWGD